MPNPQAGLRSIFFGVVLVVYPTDEMIRELAYKLWTDAGQPEDREQEFWHQAERQLQIQSSQPNQPDNTG
jgi:hypothetical protein